MSSPEQRLCLGRGVQWRAYADGVVVYVAETCETHLLPPDCKEVLEAAIAGVILEPATSGVTIDPSQSGDPDMTFEGTALRELLELKILEPAH